MVFNHISNNGMTLRIYGENDTPLTVLLDFDTVVEILENYYTIVNGGNILEWYITDAIKNNDYRFISEWVEKIGIFYTHDEKEPAYLLYDEFNYKIHYLNNIYDILKCVSDDEIYLIISNTEDFLKYLKEQTLTGLLFFLKSQ